MLTSPPMLGIALFAALTVVQGDAASPPATDEPYHVEDPFALEDPPAVAAPPPATPQTEAAAEASPAPRAANDEAGTEAANSRGGRTRREAPEAPVLERQTAGAGPGDDGSDESGGPRRGWWQRTFGG